MRISDWSSDVCSSDLRPIHARQTPVVAQLLEDRRVHRSATLYMRIALRVADPARDQQAHERRLLFQIRIRQFLQRRNQWRIAQWIGEFHADLAGLPTAEQFTWATPFQITLRDREDRKSTRL